MIKINSPIENKAQVDINETLGSAQKVNEQETNSIYDDKSEVKVQSSCADELGEVFTSQEQESIIDSAITFFKNLFNITKKEEPSTKDGVIQETYQQKNGDCWLISGVNALSYTDSGAELIKEALEYHDNYTTVHLKGVGDYNVTDEELAAAKEDIYYARGDDDMVILELAMQKALDKARNNEISFKYTPFLSSQISKNDPNELSTQGGIVENAIYLITGKASQAYEDKNEMGSFLENFELNKNSNQALGASINEVEEARTIKDINGRTINLPSQHVYSIKEVSKDTITVINPWDSTFDITVSKEDFVNTFDRLAVCDLSENNPSKNLVAEAEIQPDGSKVFTHDTKDYKFELKSGGYEEVDKVKIFYSKNDVLTKEDFLNEDGSKIRTIKYDPTTAKKSESIVYYNDGAFAISILANDDKNRKLYTFDEKGNELDSITMEKELSDVVWQRDLGKYGMSLEQVEICTKLSDEQWSAVKALLAKDNLTIEQALLEVK